MSTSTQGNMAPFSFSDPNLQPTVTNPITGDVWQFVDGVWMIADPNDPDGDLLRLKVNRVRRNYTA